MRSVNWGMKGISVKKRIAKPGPPSRNATSRDVDRYLARLPADVRIVLQQLRLTIRAAAPEAAEVISYQIPTFKYFGPLVAFAAFPNHCSFYTISRRVMAVHKDMLGSYKTSGVTIRFQPSNPLPAAMVKKLVKARIAENKRRAQKKRRGES